MKKLLFAALALACLASGEASAQQQPDPAVLQTTLNLTRADRNNAMDALTEAIARQQVLVTELAKARARIKELEAKQEKPKDPADLAPTNDKPN